MSVHLENGERFVLTVIPDRSYASEVKVVKRIFHWLCERGFIRRVLEGKLFLGDKAYDSKKSIEVVDSVGLKPYIKVRETFRGGIRSEERLRAKELVESDGIYRYRGSYRGDIWRDKAGSW